MPGIDKISFRRDQTSQASLMVQEVFMDIFRPICLPLIHNALGGDVAS